MGPTETLDEFGLLEFFLIVFPEDISKKANVLN